MHISSDKLKQAVAEAFYHERERNGKLSSHSQLERWIICELNKHQKPDQMVALRLVMDDLFGIDFDSEGAESDIVKSTYADLGMSVVSTGGGCEAFRKDVGGSSFILVTVQDGLEIPTNVEQPVSFGLYRNTDDGNADELIFYKEYISTGELLADKHVTYLFNC